MNAFLKMTWTEMKLFAREPVAMFFTFAFPIVILIVFGSIFGNEPVAEFGNLGNVDVSVPGYIGMITGTIGLIGLPIALANYREQGVLRRLKATPLNPSVILGAQVAMNLVMQAVGVILLFATARAVYDLQFPERMLSVAAAILLSGLSFFSLGFVLANLAPTPRTAQAMGMGILFPMLFLSGGAMPREILPETIRKIGEFLPLTHVIELVKGLWYGQGWDTTAVLVLTGIFIVCALISSRTFRWE